MLTNTKQENRKIAFDNYLKKRGLEKYSFFITKSYDYNGSIYLILSDDVAKEFEKIFSTFHMIKSVHTLIKKTRDTTKKRIPIKVRNNVDYMTVYNGWDNFDSLEEFKRFSIIKKLAGINT